MLIRTNFSDNILAYLHMYHFISLFLTISVIFSNITLDLSGFSFVLLRFLSVVCWCHIHCHCSYFFFLKITFGHHYQYMCAFNHHYIY